MNLAQRIISDKTASLEFLQGTTPEGIPFYAYIVMKEADAINMRKPDSDITLPDNSIILFQGLGDYIPESIHEEALIEFEKMKKPA